MDVLNKCTNLFTTLVSNEQQVSSNQSINGRYSKEFQSMLDSLDEQDCVEESISIVNNTKRRRLSLEKVKKLEKHFEVDNKLEPSRKAKLADELGLQGRQVAIWFQNRRARLKSKHLEKEYEILKSENDALKLSFDVLENENASLKAEIGELKRKLDAKSGNTINGDDKILFSESNNDVSKQIKTSPDGTSTELKSYKLTDDLFDDGNELRRDVDQFKDSLSDSGSSEMLNFASVLDWFQASSNVIDQNQFGNLEDHECYDNDRLTEESCNLFFVDQTPIMQWYN